MCTDFKLAGDSDLWSLLHTDLYGVISPLGGFRKQSNQRSRQMQQYVIEAKITIWNWELLGWKPRVYRHMLKVKIV